MTSGIIPDEVRQFLLRHIDSVAQLEALLLLRTEAGREWAAADVARRLYIGAQDAAPLLRQLHADGLLSAAGDAPLYRYAPASAELGALVTRLAEVYAKHLVPVTHLIHSKPQPKPKPKVQEFADAFKLRKDES
jgi:hypothetical protein